MAGPRVNLIPGRSARNYPAFHLTYETSFLRAAFECNLELTGDYGEIMALADANIDGYEPTAGASKDRYGNVRQWKVLRDGSVGALVEELARLEALR